MNAAKTEFWHAVAGGLLNAWVAKMQAVTNHDSRQVLDPHWADWIRIESFGALGYGITGSGLALLLNEVDDRVYWPKIRDQAVPLATGVSEEGGVISADDPGDGFTLHIYEWGAGNRTFTELGPLAENSSPGAGAYVVANVDDGSGETGLPSSFVMIE